MARCPAGDVMGRERRDWPALRASSTVLTCVSLCQFLELACSLNFREDARRSSLVCAYVSPVAVAATNEDDDDEDDDEDGTFDAAG